MNVTEYKGFKIGAKLGMFTVEGAQFKPEGYATISHAKGAITNYLKANNAMHVDDLTINTRAAAMAATSDDKDHASVPVEAPSGPSSPKNEPTGEYLPRDTVLAAAFGKTITAGDLEDFEALTACVHSGCDHLLALLRYEGFLHTDGSPKQPDSRSRNKREGRYAGRWKGLHMRSKRAAQPGRDVFNRTAYKQ